jgi:hypothetical protein
MFSAQFLPESTGSWQESSGKKTKNFPAGIIDLGVQIPVFTMVMLILVSFSVLKNIYCVH